MLRSEDVIGWFQNTVGGSLGADIAQVKNIAVIPDTNFSHSQAWMCVNRTINGSDVYHLEFMEEQFELSSTVARRDAFMVDCGLSLDAPVTITNVTSDNPPVVTAAGHGFSDGDKVTIESVLGATEANGKWIVANKTASTFELNLDPENTAADGSAWGAYTSGGVVRKRVTTITGLDHLEGEDVDGLADGAVFSGKTVSSGSITLDVAAAVVHAGLPYTSNLVTFKPDLRPGSLTEGQTIPEGKITRIPRVMVRVLESAEGEVGEEGAILDALIRTTPDDPIDTLGLTSDQIEVPIDMEWGRETPVHIRQSLPLPFTAASMSFDVVQEDA
jgi:hypothetical protein